MTLSPEEQKLVAVGMYLLGWALSVAWPFVVVKIQTGVAFDWRKVGGRIAGGILGLFLAIVSSNQLETIGALSYAAAFIAGLGFSSFGNNARRTYNIRKSGE